VDVRIQEFNTAVEMCVRNYLRLAEVNIMFALQYIHCVDHTYSIIQKSRIFEKVQAPHIGKPSVFHKVCNCQLSLWYMIVPCAVAFIRSASTTNSFSFTET